MKAVAKKSVVMDRSALTVDERDQIDAAKIRIRGCATLLTQVAIGSKWD